MIIHVTVKYSRPSHGRPTRPCAFKFHPLTVSKMVSFSCYKFCRGLRSMCTPILTVVGFSLILTYMLVLYQPTRGPGIKQQMGWQSWEVVDAPNAMTSSNISSPPSSPNKPAEGVDWWNVSTPDEKVDYSSLPLDVWSPLLPHDTGRTYHLFCFYSISDKRLSSIRNCYYSVFYGSSCGSGNV